MLKGVTHKGRPQNRVKIDPPPCLLLSALGHSPLPSLRADVLYGWPQTANFNYNYCERKSIKLHLQLSKAEPDITRVQTDGTCKPNFH